LGDAIADDLHITFAFALCSVLLTSNLAHQPGKGEEAREAHDSE
jgi:hypothetical protein